MHVIYFHLTDGGKTVRTRQGEGEVELRKVAGYPFRGRGRHGSSGTAFGVHPLGEWVPGLSLASSLYPRLLSFVPPGRGATVLNGFCAKGAGCSGLDSRGDRVSHESLRSTPRLLAFVPPGRGTVALNRHILRTEAAA